MKEALLTLYRDHRKSFTGVVKAFPNDTLSGPFLMSPRLNYAGQKNPLMVIGQETNGWSRHTEDPEKQMVTYEAFDLGRGMEDTAFWNVVRKAEAAIGNEIHSCAWTNLSKFDLYGGKPYGKYEKKIATLDAILRDEIQIVSPKICLFFTGPLFDRRIKKIFEGLEYIQLPGWAENQLCQLKHPKLPEWTFRSYHPKSLKLRSLEKAFISYLHDRFHPVFNHAEELA